MTRIFFSREEFGGTYICVLETIRLECQRDIFQPCEQSQRYNKAIDIILEKHSKHRSLFPRNIRLCRNLILRNLPRIEGVAESEVLLFHGIIGLCASLNFAFNCSLFHARKSICWWS